VLCTLFKWTTISLACRSYTNTATSNYKSCNYCGIDCEELLWMFCFGNAIKLLLFLTKFYNDCSLWCCFLENAFCIWYIHLACTILNLFSQLGTSPVMYFEGTLVVFQLFSLTISVFFFNLWIWMLDDLEWGCWLFLDTSRFVVDTK
jgi:hypothetical protein